MKALPATPETVMLYIGATITGDGAALSTIRSWMAAINRVHREAGHPAPSDDPVMGMFLRGLARTHPPRSRPHTMSALRIADLREACRHLQSLRVDPRALRDAAVLGLHVAGLGDGEISRLIWPDIRVSTDRIRIKVQSVRADRQSRVVNVGGTGVAKATTAAVESWKRIATTSPEAVFSAVDASGWREEQALTARAIFKIRKSRLDSLGTPSMRATPWEAISLLSGAPSEVLRDHAAILVGFAGAFRRNEVTNLRWTDIDDTGGGIIVHLRWSKTDLSGRGHDVGIPTGKSELTCPVRALGAWRDRCIEQLGTDGLDERRIFTHVGRAGRITDRPLSPEGLTRVIQRRTHQAAIEGHWGGRSLRAGFISTAADLEIPLETIARQSRHKTLDSLIRYIRSEPLRGNPASRVGL